MPAMTSEPSKDAIDNFMSFTNVTREAAVLYLKVQTSPPVTILLAARDDYLLTIFHIDRRTTLTLIEPSIPISKIRAVRGLK